jgi:serine/threonine-protein kinase RsbW
MKSGHSWSSAFPGTLSGITEAAGWIDGLAAAQGFPDDLTFGIQLCVEELLANVVRHGGGGWPGAAEPASGDAITMSLALSIADGAVTVTVEDNGKPFDTAAAPASPVTKPLEEATPGGLGIQLIKQFSQELAYERSGGLNRTTLKFLWPRTADSLL